MQGTCSSTAVIDRSTAVVFDLEAAYGTERHKIQSLKRYKTINIQNI